MGVAIVAAVREWKREAVIGSGFSRKKRREEASRTTPPARPEPKAAPVPVPEVKPGGRGLMVALDDLLGNRAPIQIPGKIKFLMARFGHWLVIGLMLLTLPGQLMALGWSAGFIPFWILSGSGGSLKVAFSLATLLFLLVLLILALPGLQARKVIGWQLLMLANGVNLVYGLLAGGVIGPILGAAVGLYVLIQLRRYYT